MNDAESTLSSLLRFLATEKSTAVTRMHTSFNWAFGIMSAFSIGVASRTDFQKNHLSWFLLSVALILLTHFFVRTAKDYVNQIRFAALQKHCLACLFSLQVCGDQVDLGALGKKLDQYFIAWKSPKPLWDVLKKTLFDHGFFALFAVVITLMTWVAINVNWNDWRTITTTFVLVVIETLVLNDFRTFYFECEAEEESMKGKD